MGFGLHFEKFSTVNYLSNPENNFKYEYLLFKSYLNNIKWHLN